MRVLITNRILSSRTGTELYVRDLALGLLARGHHPVVFTPVLGEVSREIRAATVPVTDDLSTIAEPPDVIHGHHGPETLAALLAFPHAPAVAVCHSWVGWADVPLRHPRVLRHVAVDHTCRDRLCQEHGVPPAGVHVVPNGVDLERFLPRAPLPPRPRRALVFSNAAGRPGAHDAAIREACRAEGIELDVAGGGVGRTLDRPEAVLGGYDLVFAKARAALEAMASGAAVVLADAAGAGPMVTHAEFARLRELNFGVRALRHPVTAEWVRGQLRRYDAADAARVTALVRASAGTEMVLDDLCALYEDVVHEHRGRMPDAAAEGAAAAAYVQWLAPRLYERDVLWGLFRALLRAPVLGRVVRGAGRRSQWLRFLLRMEERG